MTTEQPIAKVMLDEKPVKRHSSEKPKKVSDTFLPSNDSGKRAKSNESFDDTMVRIRRNIQRMNDSIKRDRQAWNAFTNHLDELAKRSESNHGPDRFEVIESNLSVLTFGFDTIKKQSDEATAKSNKTAKRFNTFKDQITEMMNCYVRRISEAEQKGIEVQEVLAERERELFEVKGQLRKQEKEIETLKRMLNEQREMMEMYASINSMNLNRIMNGRPF